MSRKIELLAPAGSLEKMKYAFAYGADTVYMGMPDFSLRVRINRFTMEDVKEAIDYAHKLKKKIYVTVNIVAHNEHLKKLPPYLKKLNKWRPDALIISDPGVIGVAKENAPDLPVHLSTQANTTNWRAVKFWKEQGVRRIILGREVTLEEIKEIHKKVKGIELEYFVHGAMCMSYSGRCMLSAWLTGRSANLGDCAQPCRWKYGLYPPQRGKRARQAGGCYIAAEVEESSRLGMKIPVEEDKHGTYIFNSKDMCFIEYLPELIDAGVCSFKIEGRAKSVAYLASVVKAYREALDFICGVGTGCGLSIQRKHLKSIKKRILDKLNHRGYTTGFLFGRDMVEQNTENSHVGGEEEFVGEVAGCVKLGKKYQITIRPHNALRVGDTIRIMQPSNMDLRMTIQKMYNEDNRGIGCDLSVQSGHGGSGKNIVLEVGKKVEKFGILFKKL